MSGYADYFFQNIITYIDSLLDIDIFQLTIGLLLVVIAFGCFRKLLKINM